MLFSEKLSNVFQQYCAEVLKNEKTFLENINILLKEYPKYQGVMNEEDYSTLHEFIQNNYVPLKKMTYSQNLIFDIDVINTEKDFLKYLGKLGSNILLVLSYRLSYLVRISGEYVSLQAKMDALRDEIDPNLVTPYLHSPISRFLNCKLAIQEMIKHAPDSENVKKELENLYEEICQILTTFNASTTYSQERNLHQALQFARQKNKIAQVGKNACDDVKALIELLSDSSLSLKVRTDAELLADIRVWIERTLLPHLQGKYDFTESVNYLEIFFKNLSMNSSGMDEGKWRLLNDAILAIKNDGFLPVNGITKSLVLKGKEFILNEDTIHGYQLGKMLSHFYVPVQEENDYKRAGDTLIQFANFASLSRLKRELQEKQARKDLALKYLGELATPGYKVNWTPELHVAKGDPRSCSDENIRYQEYVKIKNESDQIGLEIERVKQEINQLTAQETAFWASCKNEAYKIQFPFHAAVMADDFDAIKRLIEEGSTHDLFNQVDSHGKKPIFYACQAGNADMFQLLFRFTEINELEEMMLKETIDDLVESQENKVGFKKIRLHFNRPYDHLWRNQPEPVHPAFKIHLIFKDYYAPVLFGMLHCDTVQRMLTLHWRKKQHITKAEILAHEFARYLLPADNENGKPWNPQRADSYIRGEVEMCTESSTFNANGSFARRLQFVFRELEVEKKVAENLNRQTVYATPVEVGYARGIASRIFYFFSSSPTTHRAANLSGQVTVATAAPQRSNPFSRT